MSVVYLISSFGKLSKKGDTLLFETKDYTSTIFPFRTDSLVLVGKIDITSGALSVIMKNQIDTVFLSSNARFNGKLVFSEKKNVFLRQKQFKLVENMEARVKCAKAIALTKVKNQLTFMMRIRRKTKEDELSIRDAINKNKKILEDIETADSLDKLRGYEGIAARNYFQVFARDIIQDWAVFNGRSKNPPRDNVNAVLSFLYTLLYQRIDASLEAEDLDPYVGMYHELDYGKRTLTFDLQEEFRVPIVDTLAISLFNLAVLDKEDFRQVDFSTESEEYPLESGKTYTESENETSDMPVRSTRGVLLNENGLRKCIAGFEKKMSATIISPSTARTVSYFHLIRDQVQLYKRFINGEEANYKPFLYR